MNDYRSYVFQDADVVTKMELGPCLMPQCENRSGKYTYTECNLVKIDTSGRLALLAIEVNGKLGVGYWNGCFKNMFARFDVDTHRNGQMFIDDDCELSEETLRSWIHLINTYDKLYYGYRGFKVISSEFVE